MYNPTKYFALDMLLNTRPVHRGGCRKFQIFKSVLLHAHSFFVCTDIDMPELYLMLICKLSNCSEENEK